MNNSETNQSANDIVLEESKQKNINTIKVNGLYLHSKYRPVDEALKMAETSYKKNHLHILFGLGLGYIAEALLDKISETDSLLIIEPNIELSKIALEYRENQKLLNDKKVQICVGLETSTLDYHLHHYFQEYMGRFTIILSPNYAKLYPDYYKEVLEKTKEQLMMEILNNNTRHMFSELWQKNYISNLFPAFTAHNFEDLKGKLTCPIVIAAGGPSLSKQLPLLKSLKNRAFIICAGSTINSLLKENIKPNLVVTVDGGEANYKHFSSINIDDIPLVYPLVVHKDIPLNHNGEHIVFNISDHIKMNTWSEKLLSRKLGIVQTGHSVANFCLDIALQLTTGPICIIGQDLAYTNNQSHASGNEGFSIIDENKEKQRKMFFAEGYYGDRVLTDFVFLGMKNGFEQHLTNIRKSDVERDIFNSTEGGLKIEGLKQITFNQFIEAYCTKDVDLQLKTFLPRKKDATSEEWENFYKEVNQLVDHHKRIIKIADKCLEILSKIKMNNYQFNLKFNKKLDKLDVELKSELENEFIFYILSPILFKIQHSHLENENETEEESNKRIYNKSLILYEGLKNTTEQGLVWIKDLSKKIENK